MRDRLFVAACLLASFSITGTAQEPVALPLTGREAEEFLSTARVVGRRDVGEGITSPERLDLSDGTRRLRAVWKTIDVHKFGVTNLTSGDEVDFRDSYRSEVAAYELDKILGFGLVPPTVERKIDGRTGSLQLWVEGALTEDRRKKQGLEPSDPQTWNAQVFRLRLLNNLTYNTDYRNIRNVLVDGSFRVHAVDFSRAFRIQTKLIQPKDLDRFSRSALDRLAALDKATLKERLGRWLDDGQIRALLARRDAILELAQKRAAEKGEAAVFYP
jgi:hypothetical protein